MDLERKRRPSKVSWRVAWAQRNGVAPYLSVHLGLGWGRGVGRRVGETHFPVLPAPGKVLAANIGELQ